MGRTRLTLRLFGGFQARLGERGLTFPTRKAQALLAYLAVRPEQNYTRNKLAAMFWGGRGKEQARQSLRQSLSALRGAFAPFQLRILVVEGDRVMLDQPSIDVDVAEFERLASRDAPRDLERAAVLYVGDLLDGVDVGEEPFEEWLRGERARLRETAVHVLTRLVPHQAKSGSPESAIQTAVRLLALDPLREETHRTLMRLYARHGRLGDALRQYQACVSALRAELGVEPAEETRRVYREIVPRRRPVVSARQSRAPSGAGAPEPGARLFGPAGHPPLINRQKELAQLRDALGNALSRRGGTTIILGEAGIGKTRLAAELVREMERRGGRVLAGHAYETERTLPFAPWVAVLRAGLRLYEEVAPRPKPIWQDELAKLLPELGEPRSAAVGGNPIRVFEAVAHFLRDLVAFRPLLLVVENLQWADETSLRLFTFLVRRIDAWPLLMVGIVRREELGESTVLGRLLQESDGRSPLRRLSVGALSRADTAALVRALAGRDIDAPTAVRLANQVWLMSEGNPFMVVESMRALETGEIAPVHGRLPLPQRVREVIAGRLERLSPRARQIVAAAATIGREFDFALLERASALGEFQTTVGVEELVRKHVIHGIGDRLDFSHDTIREVALTQISPHRRKALHRRVAIALEQLHADNLELHTAALANYFCEGELWDKAVLYLSRAAMHAVARSANWEAVVLFDRALEALGHLPEVRRTLEHGIDLRIALEHSLLLVGEPARALEHLLEAERLAEALDDCWRLGWVSNYLSEYFRTVSEHDRALVVGQRALKIGTDLGDVTLQVETRLRLGQVCHARGDYRGAAELLGMNLVAPMAAASHHEDQSLLATLCSRRAGTGLLSVLSRVWLLWCLAELGDFAMELCDGQVRLAESASPRDPFQLMLAYLAAGRLHLRKGDIELAIQFLEKCREAQRLGNFEVWSSSISSTIGYAYLLGGRVGEAMAFLTEAIEQANSTKSVFGHSLRLAYLGEAVLLTGRTEEALHHARCALEVSRAQREHGHEAYVLRLLAEIAAHQEPLDVEATAAAYRLALGLTNELGMRPLMAQCHLGLGRLGRRAGQPDLAERHLTAATTLFREMGMSQWLEKAEAARAR
jgi:DNA-binding SARP family transcriptional activator/tetratricopeptide (TPR) repeat protein